MQNLFVISALASLAVLASVPASAADTNDISVAGKFDPHSGKALYNKICAGCHMPDAKGAQGAGAYPALANNPKLAAKSYPIFMVTQGQGGMPSLMKYLDDQQVASVINYVRTSFGNNYGDAVSEQDVKAISQR